MNTALAKTFERIKNVCDRDIDNLEKQLSTMCRDTQHVTPDPDNREKPMDVTVPLISDPVKIEVKETKCHVNGDITQKKVALETPPIKKELKRIKVNVPITPPIVIMEESTIMKDIVYAQRLNMSTVNKNGFKTPTYYAKMEGRGDVFVKGPFESEKKAKIQRVLDKTKKLLLLNSLGIELVYLKPDILDQFKMGEPRPFLVMNNLCNDGGDFVSNNFYVSDGLKIVLQRNKLNARVISKERLRDPVIMKQYLLVLCFRYAFGITNTTHLNILLDTKTSKVYSVDENGWFFKETFDSSPKKYLYRSKGCAVKYNTIVEAGFMEHKDFVLETLMDWRDTFMAVSGGCKLSITDEMNFLGCRVTRLILSITALFDSVKNCNCRDLLYL